VSRTVDASTFSTLAGVPSALRIQPGIDGVRSLFSRTSVYQNRMSSAPNGAPSDQRAPLRNAIVQVLKSADGVALSAIFGSIFDPSGENRNSAS
jgi:hypothetical protein